MNRSWICLRRVLFGVSCAVVFGFGATHAAAADNEEQARACTCQPATRHYIHPEDCWECPSGVGRCDGKNPTLICD